jgi:hypothetical protein
MCAVDSKKIESKKTLKEKRQELKEQFKKE